MGSTSLYISVLYDFWNKNLVLKLQDNSRTTWPALRFWEQGPLTRGTHHNHSREHFPQYTGGPQVRAQRGSHFCSEKAPTSLCRNHKLRWSNYTNIGTLNLKWKGYENHHSWYKEIIGMEVLISCSWLNHYHSLENTVLTPSWSHNVPYTKHKKAENSFCIQDSVPYQVMQFSIANTISEFIDFKNNFMELIIYSHLCRKWK